MRPAQFLHLLHARGPALDSWPKPERRAGRQLLASSQRCRDAYLAALATDETLEAPVDPALLSRLTAGLRTRMAPDRRPPRSTHSRTVRVPVGWAALAACGLLGAWVGWLAAPPSPQPYLLASVQIPALDADPLDAAP
jgi:hypothetical protein